MSNGVGGASTARTDVDVSVCTGPIVFVIVVRTIEAEVGVGITALGPTVIPMSYVLDWKGMLLKFANIAGSSTRRRRRHEDHEVYKRGEDLLQDSRSAA